MLRAHGSGTADSCFFRTSLLESGAYDRFHTTNVTVQYSGGQETTMDLASMIRDVPDFPVEGILFKDITTLLSDAEAFRYVIASMTERFRDEGIDLVVAIESRGFIFGAPLAYHLGAGFVPVRKPGKLPAEKISQEYSLEYGTNVLEIHTDAISPGHKVLVVDDLLATGGSVRATVDLVERLGGEIVGIAFLIDLTFLNGMKKLEGYDVYSMIQY